MPAFDELRNELDLLCGQGYPVNSAFHELVERYKENTDETVHLVHLQEQLEREGHKVTWP